MGTFIVWVAYLGGWLLVAGPLLQSRLELEAEQGELRAVRDRLRSAPRTSVEPVSGWWWLVPPVAWVKSARRGRAAKAELFEVLTPEESRAVTHYLLVSRAWLFVAGGALFIAVKETWELVHHQHWSTATFWGLVLLGGLAATTLAAGGRGRGARDEGDRREAAGERRAGSRRAAPPTPPRRVGAGGSGQRVAGAPGATSGSASGRASGGQDGRPGRRSTRTSQQARDTTGPAGATDAGDGQPGSPSTDTTSWNLDTVAMPALTRPQVPGAGDPAPSGGEHRARPAASRSLRAARSSRPVRRVKLPSHRENPPTRPGRRRADG